MAEERKDQVQPADPVRAYRFEGDGEIPNSALPLLVYPGAVEVSGADPAAAFERVFAAQRLGRLVAQWDLSVPALSQHRA